VDPSLRSGAIEILSGEVYKGFGPTLASEHLAKGHGIQVCRETLRGWMQSAGLWKGRRRREGKRHEWRERRPRRGELVQWDTSEHDWLEGRGTERLYLISMIDDATSRLHARFVLSDSTEENMRTLRSYLEASGRPAAFYTDKASLFRNNQKRRRDSPGVDQDVADLPPTQIGRALAELGIVWIAAHTAQAKGRVERSFDTAQDRLVKEMRVAGIATLEQANRFLADEFLPWWNKTLAVEPASPDDAHRPLEPAHDLASILSHVETRQVKGDFTVQYGGVRYAVAAKPAISGLRGAKVRVERRLDGTVAMRFGECGLEIRVCAEPAKAARQSAPDAGGEPKSKAGPRRKSEWMKEFWEKPAPPLGKAIAIANAGS
jgi:hypothetical protein